MAREAVGAIGETISMPELLATSQAAFEEGRWDDALAGFSAAFARLPREGTAADAAEILRRAGSVHRMRGEVELSGELFEASHAIAELNGLDQMVARALLGLAAVAQSRGDLEESEAHYERARGIGEALGDERTVAMAEQNLGVLANIRGEIPVALGRYERALARHRNLGDDRMAAFTLNNMGMAHADLGELDAADRCYAEASALADRCGDARVLAAVSLNRAEVLLRRGSHVEAREACDFAVEIFVRHRITPSMAEAHRFYGELYRVTGKSHLSEIHLEQAVELARECQDRLLEGEAEAERALLYLALKCNREALQCLTRAHGILSGLEARRDIAELDRRLDQLEATFLEAMHAWAESIESKDRYTAGHCERVAHYACLLAEEVGVTGRDLTWFRMGAVLHDVGKISVPEEILNKPGKLDAEEWRVMMDHTVRGDEIVAALEFPWDIRPIVRSHHEHWAGTGYPDGLRGEEIPLHARILCVADVYDALASARSYKPALPQEEALRIMEGDSGRIFDPELFAAFRTILRRQSGPGTRVAGTRLVHAAP